MATVLRIRRKRTCDPVEALVLSCKRPKSETLGAASAAAEFDVTGTGDVQKVFKLVGTVNKKEQPIATQIKTALTTTTTTTTSKPTKHKHKSSSKTKSNSSSSKSSKAFKDKSRLYHEASVKGSRYKVISSHRGLKLQELDNTSGLNGTVKPDVTVKPSQQRLRPTSLISRKSSKQRKEEAEARQLFSLFDLEHEDQERGNGTVSSTKSADPDVILCNSVQMIREKLVLDDNTIPDSEYVYDLYYIDEDQVDMEMNEGATVGMHHGQGDGELVYEFYPSDNTNAMYAEEDDDSNDEDNWRNDYPDEDPDKRHPDLFDELLDDYNYGENSSEDDLDYGESNSDYRHRAINKLDLEYCDDIKDGSGSDLDDYAF